MHECDPAGMHIVHVVLVVDEFQSLMITVQHEFFLDQVMLKGSTIHELP